MGDTNGGHHRGATIATVTGQVIGFLVLLRMTRMGGNIRIKRKNFQPGRSALKEITYGGAPSLARQSLVSVSVMVLNVAAGRYGDAAIAAMSIVSRICMFIHAFIIGIGQGFQPICGFCYGAGLLRRVYKVFRLTLRIQIMVMALFALVGYAFAPELISWFRAEDGEVIRIGILALRWQLIPLPLACRTVMCNMTLQTIRKPLRAIFLSP